MAWVYSHRISGMSGRLAAACLTRSRRRVHEGVDVGVGAAVGGGAFVVERARGVALLGPLVARPRRSARRPIRCPCDQMITEGWFLSRSTMRCDAVQVGRLPGRIVGQAVLRVVAVVVRLRCWPRPSRRGRSGRRARTRPARWDSGEVRTAFTLNCFMSWMSLHHRVDASRTCAVSGLCSWRFTPLIRTGLAVDQQARVPDLDLAEADVLRDHFEHRAGGVLEREQQLVEVRAFRRTTCAGWRPAMENSRLGRARRLRRLRRARPACRRRRAVRQRELAPAPVSRRRPSRRAWRRGSRRRGRCCTSKSRTCAVGACSRGRRRGRCRSCATCPGLRGRRRR